MGLRRILYRGPSGLYPSEAAAETSAGGAALSRWPLAATGELCAGTLARCVASRVASVPTNSALFDDLVMGGRLERAEATLGAPT